MLDREQDKAINEARRELANPDRRSSEYIRDYVAAVVVKHSPGLIDRLSETQYPADRDGIAGEILRWGREDAPTAEIVKGTTVNLDYLDYIQNAMYNHIRQVLTRATGQDKPNIVADPLSRSDHLR